MQVAQTHELIENRCAKYTLIILHEWPIEKMLDLGQIQNMVTNGNTNTMLVIWRHRKDAIRQVIQSEITIVGDLKHHFQDGGRFIRNQFYTQMNQLDADF